jgi:hypothetical protein
MSLRHLSFQDLQSLDPAIREHWRTSHKNVIVSLTIKDAMKGGYKADLIVVASSVFVLEWLADYLEVSHSATASIDDCMAIAISLVREAVQLAEVLP